MSLARNLGTSGAQVIAVDRSHNLVNEVRDSVDVAVQLDSTDAEALASQDIGSVDVCVVAIGENFEASLLTTVLAKRMGVPLVICRAQTDVHSEIFRQIGADEVIQPELHAGEHLALRLANEHIADFLQLSEELTIVEMLAPRKFIGKSLLELRLRDEYGVNLVAIKRLPKTAADSPPDDAKEVATDAATEAAADEPAERHVILPRANDVIEEDDLLAIVGTDDSLARLPRE